MAVITYYVVTSHITTPSPGSSAASTATGLATVAHLETIITVLLLTSLMILRSR